MVFADVSTFFISFLNLKLSITELKGRQLVLMFVYCGGGGGAGAVKPHKLVLFSKRKIGQCVVCCWVHSEDV